MNEICAMQSCTGCNLCASVCPKQCISFTKEYKGHLYPVIDQSICIDCKKCAKVCIANNKQIVKYEATYGCYAAWHKDSAEQYESASGGLATAISKYVIRQGGKVYGCAWNDKLEAVHIGIESEHDLEKLRKSKYSLSKVSRETFEDIKTEVKSSRLCLFIGVACQCDAVRKYVGGNYNNLIIIDLLCRGGASPVIFKEHIQYLCKKHRLKNINNITFRGGDYDCRLALRNGNEVKYYGYQYEDEYFLGFMSHVLYRQSCFACQYASRERVGDITLADFWGLDEGIVKKYDFHKRGVNLLLVNTEKGKTIFEAIKAEINLIERNIDEAIAGNETLQCPTPVPGQYDMFWQNMSKAITFEKVMHITFKQEYKQARINQIYRIIIPPLRFIKRAIFRQK